MRSRCPRELSRRRSRAGRSPAFVAISSSSRETALPSRPPMTVSASPSPYTSAVSSRLPPAATYVLSWAAASSGAVSRPQVMVPSASRDTRSPARPSGRCCMVRETTGVSGVAGGNPPGTAGYPGAACDLGGRGRGVEMRLSLSLGYQTAWTTPADHLALAQEADRLGYSAVWAAEAYGSDAVTMLAWIAGQTQRIDLGSAVMQIPARTPAMTAMTAATLDTLSGGRFRLGLGVSGPQVSEGWHGVRFGKPLKRTREYVEIGRQAIAGQHVSYSGDFYTLPLPDGPGKALKLGFHPFRDRIPTYLAAVGPKNLELAGELTDGWLAVFLAPEFASEQLSSIAAGPARVGLGLDRFDIVPAVTVGGRDDTAA